MNFTPGYDLDQEQKKIISLASLGGMLEFFDFTIYGLFAGYFSKQFFPTQNPMIAIMASYAVFMIGYLIRPLGGIIFSHIGDELGRKKVLVMTMTLMGIATFGLGLIPTYQQIGIGAPLLMIVFRLLQGLAFGGEIPGMIVYTSEAMPHKRSFGIGGSFTGVIFGIVLGILINFILVKSLNKVQLAVFGWRIPFLIGGILCFVAYKARKELHETEAFKAIHHIIKVPLFEVFKKHTKTVLIGIGLVSIVGTGVLLLIIFMPTYLTTIIKLSSQQSADIVLLAAITSVISAYLTGLLAHKLDLYRLTVSCLILILIGASFCYYTISLHQYIYAGIITFGVFEGALTVLPLIYLSYIFPAEVRLSGVALSYNIGFVVFCGLAPIFVTALIDKSGLIYYSPVFLIIVSALFCYWAINTIKEWV